jgi:hypothetical protein
MDMGSIGSSGNAVAFLCVSTGVDVDGMIGFRTARVEVQEEILTVGYSDHYGHWSGRIGYSKSLGRR